MLNIGDELKKKIEEIVAQVRDVERKLLLPLQPPVTNPSTPAKTAKPAGIFSQRALFSVYDSDRKNCSAKL